MSSFYYNLLSGNEKTLYNIIYAALVEGETSISAPPLILGTSNIGRVIEYVKNDHPEFSFSIPWKFTRALAKLVIASPVEYIYETSVNRRFIEDFKRKLNVLCNSDYEKVRYVHDFIINSVDYDHNFIETEIVDPNNHNAMGVLNTGRGVCEGIARLTQLLLEAAGVEAIYCEGKSKTPAKSKIDGHAWNVVRIDGKYFYLDVSNDVCMTDKKVQKSHCYFCLSYDEIIRDRSFTLDAEFRKLQANYDEFSYFRRNGQIFSSVDEIRVWLDGALNKAIECDKRELFLQFKVSEKMLSDRNNSWEALCMSALYGALDKLNAGRGRNKVSFSRKYCADDLGTMGVEFTFE